MRNQLSMDIYGGSESGTASRKGYDMGHILKSTRCTGCGACSLVCPMKAISMQQNDEGFLYPETDESKCIDCGKCINVCKIDSDKFRKPFIIAKYGRSLNLAYLRNSSSGGAFSSIVKAISRPGVHVFGAAYFPDERSIKITSTETVPLDRLMRSKYIDSYTSDSYVKAKNCLAAGENVVYSGAPCQVDGLLHFLGNTPKDNLFTIDFVCHGMPSRKYFEEHVIHLEEIYGVRVVDVNFRPKTLGWTCMSIIYTFSNGKQKEFAAYADPYFKGFLEDLFLRESCYACEYRLQHVSDITIADFWSHIYLKNKIRNDEKGLSLVIANSQRGVELLESLKKGHMILNDIDNEFISRHILRQKKWSPALSASRAAFLDQVKNIGFEKASAGYMKSRNYIQMKFILKKLIFGGKIW